MPQATDADRARYKSMFPDIGDGHGIDALELRGFTLTRDWRWVPPPQGATEVDRFIIGFLMDEWDYGGLAYPCADAKESE